MVTPQLLTIPSLVCYEIEITIFHWKVRTPNYMILMTWRLKKANTKAGLSPVRLVGATVQTLYHRSSLAVGMDKLVF
jgi:hypothetical protein